MTPTLSPPATDSAAHLAVAAGRVPRATYRLQLHKGFPFRDAAEIVPYLAALGVSDAYTSPILQSRRQHAWLRRGRSRPNQPGAGRRSGFEEFSAALKNAGLGLILDTVPNHMGVFDPANGWWMDVLENGPSSTVADHFDIDWQPVKRELAGRILLPILEDQYGAVLEKGKFRFVYEEGAFFIFRRAGQVAGCSGNLRSHPGPTAGGIDGAARREERARSGTAEHPDADSQPAGAHRNRSG